MYVRVVPFAFAFVSLATPAFAREVADGDLVGAAPSSYTVQKGDTLAGIARKADIGLVELIAANPALTSSRLSINTVLTVPGQHLLPARTGPGIVVNLAALRLFRLNADGSVGSFPISVGKEGWDTPTGTTTIVDKVKDPDWHVPASIRAQDPKLPEVVPAGPDNPLGPYAMHLEWPGYMIHGTNAPWSIGKPSSHGCIRMYPEDIETVFNASSPGDMVTVVDDPVVLGQSEGRLYLQVTPTREQAAAIVSFKPVTPLDGADPHVQALKARLQALEGQGVAVDEAAVDAALARHDGMPVAIAQLPDGLDISVASARTKGVQVAASGHQTWLDRIVKAVSRVIDGVSSILRRTQIA